MRPAKNLPDKETLIQDLDKYIHAHPHSWDGVKAKALKAYLEGEHIDDICKVLGVTRQAFWKWRHAVEAQGVKGVETRPHTGRPTRMTAEQQAQLKQAVKQSPKKSGYPEKEWHGSMVQRFAEEKFGVHIQLRQAQYWLHKFKTERKPKTPKPKEEKTETAP